MSVSVRAVAVSLMMFLSAFSFATVAPAPEAQAQAASETCPEFMRAVFLTKKPLQVNPGGKCHFRFTFEATLNNQTDKFPRLCVFARVVGSDTEYGPFCTDGENFGMNVPAQVEWLWSDRPVRMLYKLCDTLAECR
jgi:hypothetical protein